MNNQLFNPRLTLTDKINNSSMQVKQDYKKVAKSDWSTLVKIVGVVLILFLILNGEAWGQKTWDGGAGTSNWGDGNNWNPNGVPALTDNVTIANNGPLSITVNGTYSCNSLNINYTGNTGGTITLSIPATRRLIVTNDINLTNNNNGGENACIDVAGGQLDCSNIIMGNATSTTDDMYILLSNANSIVNVKGNITMVDNDVNNYLLFTANGSINVGGSINGTNGGAITSTAGGGANAPTTGVVNFNGSSAQTSSGLRFYTLKVNNSTGFTLLGASSTNTLTIGDITLNSIFNDGGYQLTSTGTLNLTSGIFKLGSATTATTWPAFTTRNISTGTTVEYSGGVAQNVSNTPTYENLTLSGTGTKTASGSITVNGTLDYQESIFNIGGNTLNLGGTATRNGVATGTISCTNGNVSITGTGDFGTLYFTAGSQTLTTFNLNRGGNGIVGLGTNLTLAGNLVNTQGVLSIGNNTLTLNLNTAVCGVGTGIIIGGTNSTVNVANVAAGAANIPSMTIGNLTINRTGGVSMCGNVTVNNTLTLTAGNFNIGANTLALNGPAIAGTPANLIESGTSSMIFGGTAAGITIPNTITTLTNLTIGNTSGVGISGALAINGVLTLEAGLLTLGTNNLTLGATASIAGTPSSSAMVVADSTGQLIRTISGTVPTTYIYPIGDNTAGADYSPVSLTFSTNSVGTRTVGVRVTDAVHPQYNSNGAQTDYLGRYWTFSDAGGGTYTYTASFSYVAADINGTESNIKVNRYNATWFPIVSGASTNTMSIITGLTQATGALNGSAFTGRVEPSATYTWNQAGTANFTTAANWTPNRTTPEITDILQFSNGATTICTNVPSQTVNRIVVSGNTNVNLQSAAAGQIITISGGIGTNLDVQSGSTLQLGSAGANAISINYLPATQNASIAGNLIIATNTGYNNTYDATNSNTIITGSITNAGTLTSTASNLNFSSGATYNHNYTTTAGTLPTATWNSNSTLAFIGYTSNTVAPSGLNQSFGNLLWNCSTQTGTVDLNAGLTALAGNFTLQNTNTGALLLTSGAVLNPIAITGNLLLNGGTLSLTAGASNATINVAGNFSIATGATLNMVAGAVAGVGTINLLGNFNMTGGTITEGGAATTDAFNFSNTSTQTFAKSGGTITNQINFNVLSGATLDMGTSVLDGANDIFNLNSGGTLISGNQNGIYAATANGNVQTLTRTYSPTANYTFNYSGAGTQNTGTGFVAGNNVTISSANGATLTSNAAISGILTLNQPFTIGAQTLTLSGPAIAGTPTYLTTNNTSNLIFNGSSTGITLPSSVTTLNNLTINNTNGVSLNSSIALSAAGVLTLTSGNLILGDYNFTVTAALGGTFGLGKMIVTNGAGSFIKSSAATGNFVMTYPVGTNGYYSPMVIGTLAATAAGGNTVAVRAVSSRHSYVPFVNDALMKYWVVSTTGLTGITDARVTFAYGAGEVVGNGSLYVPRNWNGSAYIAPTSATAAGVNPFGTNGAGNTMLAGDWTAIDPTTRTTFYSYQNGNWNDPNTWTLDPSAQLYTNPSNLIPTSGDKARINTGHKVTIPAGLSNQSINSIIVEGTLDLGATTGHTFSYLTGSGRIRISNADIFPTTTTNTFFTTDEGTIEYYGNSFTLTTARNIYHLEVNMTAGQTLTLMATPYNLAGNLTVKQGTFRINDNASTVQKVLTIQKDITVSSGAFFTVGQGNTLNGTIDETATGAMQFYLAHNTINCYGNFTNNGTVRFTNQAAPVYNAFTSTGAISLFMKGLSDNTLTCNGTTDLYNLVIDKGSDQSYKLTTYSSNQANFRLFGANGLYDYATGGGYTQENPELRKALWIKNGTLELTGYLFIPSLTESNGDYYIPANGALWINGTNVIVWSTDRTNPGASVGGIQGTRVDITNGGSQSFSIFGNLQVSKGFFTTGSHGIVLWYQATTFGSILIEGGQCDLPGIRTATGSTTGKFSFTQTGGLIRFLGDNGNEALENSASLSILGNDPTFVMTGGTMEFYDGPANGIIRIETNPSNIDVSGGTISVIRNNAASDNFSIYTTAPFYNLILTGAATTALTTNLNTAIIVQNNLTINDYSTLVANNNNVTIGGNFTLGNTTTTNNAVYTAGTNTTTFYGNQNSIITVANTDVAAPLTFNNLTVDKTPTSSMAAAWSVTLSSPGRSETSVAATNYLTTVANDMFINEGKWNNYRFKNRVQRHITNYGTILGDATNTGRITLETGGVQHQLTGSTSVVNSFGDIELNNVNGALLNSNISTNNFILTAGVMNIGTYNLAVTGTLNGTAPFSTTRMIQSYGSASSQGVTLSLSLAGTYTNQVVALIPVGVEGLFVGSTAPFGVAGIKYTPLTITLNGNIGVGPYNGTINVRPINEYHPTGDPNKTTDQIQYYWKTTVTGTLTSITNTMVNYDFGSSYAFNFGGGKFVVYYRNSSWTEGASSNGAPPLSFPSTGFSTTDYSAGKRLAFRTPQYLYSRQSGNWSTLSTWSTIGHGTTSAPAVLNNFDVYEIGGFGGVNHQVTVTANTTVASKVIILGKSITGIATDPPPSLIVTAGTTGHDFNLVTGGGRFVLNDGTFPAGDFLDFSYNDEATFEYSGGTYTIPTNLSIYPNLIISGSAASVKTSPSVDILVRKTLKIADNTNTGITLRLPTTANGNITVNDSLMLDNQGRFEFDNGATNRTVTILKNVNCVTGGASEVNYIGINAGGAFSTPTHQLIVQGDLRLGASSLNLWTTNAQKSVDLIVNGDFDSRVYNYTGGSMTLSRLVINKSSSSLKTTIDKAFSINAVANIALKPLALTQGVLRINNASTSIVLSSGGGDFTIPSVTSLKLDQGTLSVSGDNTGITLNGLLEINGGTVSVYNAANANNYIQYSATGGQININGGLLRVGSQIRRFTTTTGGILIYNQTGGTVEIGYKDAPTATRGMLEVLNTGSYFTHSAGNLTIFTAPTAPTVPSLYIDILPAYASISASTSITLGGLAGSPQIGIYSSVPLPNLTISGTGTPTIKMWNVPLTINGNLTINSGGSFDANGLQLNIKGNFINNGTFTHNNNTTIFNGTSTQSLTGATTFYNLTKSTSNTLNVNNNIQVSNNLRVESGTLADNGNTIKVLKDVYNTGAITYGGGINSSTQLGIHLIGSSQQVVSGTGSFGKLTIDNTNGASLPLGSTIQINNALRMNQGLFDIQGNLLALGVNCAIEGSGFNAFKMIQTNTSFTDNGIKKTFPAGAETFTYPIGSMGKYTPLTLNITANGNSTGSITLKAASEIHPSIIDDVESTCQLNDPNNVLQYYWVLRSNGITGLSGTAQMNSILTDMKVSNSCGLTSADYITARLLVTSTTWNKFTSDKFDEGTGYLTFDFNATDDNGISGDYLCGLDDAIPNTVTVYQTINSGNWTNTAIWETIPAGSPIPAGGPRGSVVQINPAHTVNVISNRDVFVYKSYINGTLNLNSTTQHRLGYVFGTGTIKVVDQPTLPAGDYSGTNGFITPTGGTLEYAGTANYEVLSSIATLNNVTFSGSGNRILPNNNLEFYGNFNITGPSVYNTTYNKDIVIRKDLTMSSGKYYARSSGTPKITLYGANAQIVSGNFTAANNSDLYNLIVNKSSLGVTLSSAVEVSNNLTLTSGNINTTAANILTLTNPLSSSVSGGSSTSFINGPFKKKIDNGDDFIYPVGKNTRFGQLSALSVQSTVTNYFWTAEYFNAGYSDLSTSPATFNVSTSEYWKLNSPVDAYTANVKLRWDQLSDITPASTTITDIRVAEYNGADWIAKASTATAIDANNGNVVTTSVIPINTATNPQYYTIGSISNVKPTITLGTNPQVCVGSTSASLPYSATTYSPNQYTIDYDGTANTAGFIDISTWTALPSTPIALVVPGAASTGTYNGTIQVRASGTPANVSVAYAFTVTLSPLPAAIGGLSSVCVGTTITLTDATAGGTWSSNTPSVATINASGVVTGVSGGTSVINYIVSGCAVTKTVTVNTIPVATISLFPISNSCSNDPITLTFNLSGGTTYDFDIQKTYSTITTTLGHVTTILVTDTRIDNPIWVDLGAGNSSVIYTYTIINLTSNGCSGTDKSASITIWKIPETGPQYHISNSFGF